MRRKSRFALIVLGVLLSLLAALWGLGRALPLEHVASVEAHLQASPELVWARIVDPVASAAWRDSIRSVTRLPDRNGLPHFREESSFGPLEYVHEQREEGTRLLTRIVDNADFGGSWEYRLVPDGAGTHLSITERGEVYNPLFRVLGRYLFGLDATLRQYLDELTRALDAHA